MKRRGFTSDCGETGFTLIELMIAVALLGVGMAFMVNTFMRGWELWKRNYTDLLLQRQGRMAMEQMVQGLRQAQPSTVQIDARAGELNFSRITFTHVKAWPYQYYKLGTKLYVGMNGSTGYIADAVEALQFTYPNFRDPSQIDIGLTVAQRAYNRMTIRLQLTERVVLRNP